MEGTDRAPAQPPAYPRARATLAAQIDAVEAAAWVDQFHAAPPSLAQQLGLRTQRVGQAVVLMAPRVPFTLFNRAIGLGVGEPTTEGELDEVIQTFRVAQVEKFWIHVSPEAQPLALRAWLEQRRFGLAARKSWSKVARGPASPPVVATNLVVREVHKESASQLSGVLTRAHDMPPFVSLWLEALVGRPRWRAYVAYDGEQPVAGGLLFQQGNEAWLGMGGTIPSHRRRGGQRAIMARRIADAITAGCTLLATETGDPLHNEKNQSLSNMFASGFELICKRWNFENNE